MPDGRIGILMLAPSNWGQVWTGRHQLARRLARRFPLVWMCPAPRVGEMNGARPWRSRVESAWQAPEVTVYEPSLWLPRVQRWPSVDRHLFARRLRHAKALLTARGARDIVLYVWRPTFADALDLVPHTASVYHVNDEYSFSATSTGISALERKALQRVDRVIIHSPELMRRKGSINPCTSFLPNGADCDLFAREYPEPDDIAKVPHPRVGYAGWLKRHLDWSLIDRLSAAFTRTHFVFVGPRSPHPELDGLIQALAARPNVHFLGSKHVDELPAYVRRFDVGIMPYVRNDYTRCIYPLKAHEYLAAGLPVIGTRLPSLELLGEVVRLADTDEGWTDALRATLASLPSEPDAIAARQQVARRHDWNVLADELGAIIEATVKSRASR